MRYDDYILSEIFDKTNGRCHLCKGRLIFSEYGNLYHVRGWEVDHYLPKARGGSDSLRNLTAAHIVCNRRKGDMTNDEYRKILGESSIAEDIFEFLGLVTAIFIVVRLLNTSRNQHFFGQKDPSIQYNETFNGNAFQSKGEFST